MTDPNPPQTSGATYFFTLRLARRTDDLLQREVDHLRTAMRVTLARAPFRIDAIAVLPAVMHMLWTLPEGDTATARRIGMLKSRFSRAVPMPAYRTPAQIRRADKGIWQRHVWEHQIRDAADFTRHRDLIHLSPVHAGLCARAQDWPHSSIHRDRDIASKSPRLHPDNSRAPRRPLLLQDPHPHHSLLENS